MATFSDSKSIDSYLQSHSMMCLKQTHWIDSARPWFTHVSVNYQLHTEKNITQKKHKNTEYMSMSIHTVIDKHLKPLCLYE